MSNVEGIQSHGSLEHVETQNIPSLSVSKSGQIANRHTLNATRNPFARGVADTQILIDGSHSGLGLGLGGGRRIVGAVAGRNNLPATSNLFRDVPVGTLLSFYYRTHQLQSVQSVKGGCKQIGQLQIKSVNNLKFSHLVLIRGFKSHPVRRYPSTTCVGCKTYFQAGDA